MALKFNADEVFEMALEIERQGAKFYRIAAEIFDDPEIKRLFSGLAEMEDKHELEFASMRKHLVSSEDFAHTFDPDSTAAAYLRSMTQGKIFNLKKDLSQTLSGRETVKDILMIAIDSERDSIVFYNSLKQIVPQSLGRDRVEKIIEEEIKHIVLLSDKINAL